MAGSNESPGMLNGLYVLRSAVVKELILLADRTTVVLAIVIVVALLQLSADRMNASVYCWRSGSCCHLFTQLAAQPLYLPIVALPLRALEHASYVDRHSLLIQMLTRQLQDVNECRRHTVLVARL